MAANSAPARMLLVPKQKKKKSNQHLTSGGNTDPCWSLCSIASVT